MTDWTTLAEQQVAGFGLANGDVIDRLSVKEDLRDETPALILTHIHEDHPDPLADRDQRTVHIDDIRVTPTGRDGPRKLDPGLGDFSDRVLVEHHGHAPRAYVKHESRENGAWVTKTAWELHPAEGVVQVEGGEDGD